MKLGFLTAPFPETPLLDVAAARGSLLGLVLSEIARQVVATKAGVGVEQRAANAHQKRSETSR